MSAIHIILQGKGGVGKSLVAALLTQYLGEKGEDLYLADTDPVNDTFARYSAFNAERVKILNEDKNIDARVFDGLIENLLEHEGDAVIDNGASTFVPLSAYMLENHVIDLLQEAGKQVFIHTILTGGQSIDDTMIGLNSLITSQSAPIVVWQNEFYGAVEKDGKRFVESKLYEKNKDRIKGIVTIHKRNPDTFGKDMELMISKQMTFNQAMTSDLFTIMPRQRLKQIRSSIYAQLDNVLQHDHTLLN